MIHLLISLAFALDADGDGYADKVDCDDSNPAVYPGATELCDGLDTDCDGAVPSDEVDQDGDGYVVCGVIGVDCSVYTEHDAANADWPSTWMLVDKSGALVDTNGTNVLGGCDCNDDATDAYAVTQSPGFVEECEPLGTQVDSDCDGNPNTSNGVPVTGSSVYYEDLDGDGFGSTVYASFCNQPEGYSSNREDCDDLDANVNPMADESCNGRDDDCDGAVDNDDYQDLSGTSGCVDLFLDSDRDDWAGDTTLCLCPDDFSADVLEVELGSERYISGPLGDCADANKSIYPGAPEKLTGRDEDCDGWVAFAEADCDQDGYRAFEPSETCSADTTVTCWGDQSFDAVCDAGQGLLYIDLDGRKDKKNEPDDCDDLDSTVNPGAADIGGDGVDQDCDGEDAEIEETGVETGDTGTGDTGPGSDDKGCDCSTSGGSLAGLWLMGLVGLFWRRRR